MNDERPPLPAPAERGQLSLPAKVISKMAARCIELRGSCTRRPSVEVVDRGDTAVELEASMRLPYPRESLSPLLERLRAQVASDLERQTGLAVRRLDLRIEDFIDESQRPRSRVE